MQIIKLIILCFAFQYTAKAYSPDLPAPKVSQVCHHVSEEGYESLFDIPYGDAPGKDNLMDIHLPVDRDRNTGVIVYIHGGSWMQGDKKEFPQALISELAGKKKYVVVSINYRLVKNGKNTFPSQIEDVKKALAFISANAAKYKYNPNSFALVGASAGAHLALLYAYGYDPFKQVKTVVDLFGPTDLADESVRNQGSESNAIIENFLAITDTAAQVVKEASPAHHLNKNTGVPTLIFHGTADELVPASQSEKLYAKLKSLDIPASLQLYPGERHELRPEIARDVFSRIIGWLGQYFSS